MRISFHGQSCVCIETAGQKHLLIDPFISGNPLSDLDPDAVPCDVILLTHAHGDHVGDTEKIARRTNPLIISTVELAGYFASKGFRTHGMQPGGGHLFDFGYVKLTQAIHGSAMTVDGLPYTFGLASGILLNAEGKTIYHAGDTALFSDMKLIGEDYPIDVAFLPIGDNYTMGPKDAAKAVTFLEPRIAVPIHYNTFPLIKQDPNDFLSLLDEGVGLIMQPGDFISL
nr:metal-dependent hydrolase [uncultured Trichococcus sp.]